MDEGRGQGATPDQKIGEGGVQAAIDPEAAVRALARRLGYADRQIGRLKRALTHRSWFHENPGAEGHNERLEFLGDAVLGLLVGELLMKHHPDVTEGRLSRRRASLVNARSLAGVARGLGLGGLLRLGRGEARSGGRDKDSLLADAYEAVIGAIYLDRGLDATRTAVEAHMRGRLSTVRPDGAEIDAKTRLQEQAQALFQTTPDYVLIDESGPDHQKQFTVEVTIQGQPYGRGIGGSKKRAERAAAFEALSALESERRLEED